MRLAALLLLVAGTGCAHTDAPELAPGEGALMLPAGCSTPMIVGKDMGDFIAWFARWECAKKEKEGS